MAVEKGCSVDEDLNYTTFYQQSYHAKGVVYPKQTREPRRAARSRSTTAQDREVQANFWHSDTFTSEKSDTKF
jgi:hypothetical protein